MKSKFISAKIVPTDLLRSLGFKYEVNSLCWIDSWTLLDSGDVVTFDFQVTTPDYTIFSSKMLYSTVVVYYGYRWLAHRTRILIKEYERLTPILFRRRK